MESGVDRLTQLAERSRRQALRLVLGGVAVTTAGLVSSGRGAEAKHKNRHRKRCKGKKVGGVPCQCVPVGDGFGAACESYADCCTTTTNMICSKPGLAPDEVQQCIGGLGFPCDLPAVCAAGFTCNGVTCQPDTP
jgi:hypothetical protein